MATNKPKRSIKDFIPLAAIIVIFGIATYPQIVKTYFPSYAPQDKTIEKIVEVEKIVKQTPTVCVDMIKVMVTSVTDGDTVRATLDLPLNVSLVDQRIRCLGYDAYELSELKGLEAKNELATLLADGEVFGMTDKDNFDSFGRVLLHLYVRKNDKVIDVAKWMEEHHFVKPNKEKVVNE